MVDRSSVRIRVLFSPITGFAATSHVVRYKNEVDGSYEYADKDEEAKLTILPRCRIPTPNIMMHTGYTHEPSDDTMYGVKLPVFVDTDKPVCFEKLGGWTFSYEPIVTSTHLWLGRPERTQYGSPTGGEPIMGRYASMTTAEVLLYVTKESWEQRARRMFSEP